MNSQLYVGQDFIVLDFFHGRKILKAGGRDSQNRENVFFVGGRSCGRLMSPAQETQSMREIRLLCGRLSRKWGGLTGMIKIKYNKILTYILRSIFLEIPHLELPR
jgi:hypothetical protein